MYNSLLIQHEAQIEKISIENLIEIMDLIYEFYGIYQKINKFIARRLNITLHQYKSKIKEDWKIKGRECIKNFACDEVINFIGY